jgi:hypothetical protein
MKKVLIAAAVAGAFAAPSLMAADLSTNLYWTQALAFGDSTVTDAGVDSTTDINSIRTGGGNRLMLTWSDTLDNGLGLTAYLSMGNLAQADGGNPAGGVNLRNSHIAINGDFGKVAFGTNEHFTETDMINDPLFADYNSTAAAIYAQSVGNTTFAFVRRDSRSVWWNSNDMNGLTLKAAYIMGTQASADADQDGHQIGIQYSSGPLTVGVNQAQYNDYNAAGAESAAVAAIDEAGTGIELAAQADAVAGTEASITSYRVHYDLGMVMLKAGMWQIEQSGLTGAGINEDATAFEVTGSTLFVSMPLSAGTLYGEFTQTGDQDATTAAGTQALVDSGSDAFDIGFIMPMNANVNAFVKYGERETGIRFDATDGGTEYSEIMFGYQLMY